MVIIWRQTMRIQPSSTINLYSGVDIDMGEQLAFSSRANQQAYFASKLVRAQYPCTMVRKTGFIRIEINNQLPATTLKTCNYISFVNTNFDNKEVYARILDYDYVNNETVDIAYGIDYWQTWMFDVTFKDSYIEREHLSETLFNLAETNPYDLRIMEFRTSESLPIAKDIEKPNYEIGSALTYDGYKLGDALIDSQNITNPDVLGVLVKLSEIDFSDLDTNVQAGSIAPSTRFRSYLIDIENNQPMGYWSLPWAMYEYLHAHNDPLNPALDINQPSAIGSEWEIDGNPVSPFGSTIYQNNCAIIYDAEGCSPQGKLSDLLEMLIEFGCVSAIAGMYVIPKDIMLLAGADVASRVALQATQKTAKTVNNVVNKKLDMFPFSYLRLVCPNGDIKELHYEDFIDVQNGGDVCGVEVMLDLGDLPTLMIAPYKYRISGMSRITANDANVDEALYFKQFPTMPYIIDAYLSQVANASLGVIANNTVEYGYNLAEKQLNLYKSEAEQLARTADFAVETGRYGFGGGIVDATKDYFKGTDNGSGVGNYIRKGVDVVYGGAQLDIAHSKNTLEQNMSQNAYRNLVGSANEVANNLKDTRPAFACNKYVPSNGVGATNFNMLSYCDVIFMRVSLNPTVLSKYDNYFTHYGYTSGRCGIPRVCAFVAGSSNNDAIPHWLTVDGKPCTYIKTTDCRVTHSMLPVENQIKAMFDGGVRMINGDPSTP